MKGRLGKFGLLFLAVALCLAITGAGFAMWDKTLYIEGTVNTGEVDVGIVSVSADDTGIDPGKDKDVGWVETAFSPGGNNATVTIHNGYPCYYTYIHFTTHVYGTVPVRLQAITVNNPNPCINVSAWDTLGEQRHPGESADNTVYVHVEQCAAELATYNFTVEFHYVQWNEYTP